jgi:hypothetical protein
MRVCDSWMFAYYLKRGCGFWPLGECEFWPLVESSCMRGFRYVAPFRNQNRDLEVRVCLLVYIGRTLFCNDITVTINNRSWLGAPIA